MYRCSPRTVSGSYTHDNWRGKTRRYFCLDKSRWSKNDILFEEKRSPLQQDPFRQIEMISSKGIADWRQQISAIVPCKWLPCFSQLWTIFGSNFQGEEISPEFVSYVIGSSFVAYFRRSRLFRYFPQVASSSGFEPKLAFTASWISALNSTVLIVKMERGTC